MTKITTGLATASLAALALGALAPATATAAPLTTPSAPVGSTGSSTDDPHVQATPAPHVGQIIAHGEHRIAVNGVARGATSVTVRVEGGEGGGLAPVTLDRFSLLTDVEHLGKKAVVTAYGPNGPSEGVEIVLELGEDEGASVAPPKPVVHAVSHDDSEHFVVEGTVTYDPDLFARTEVHAFVDGAPVFAFPDENGSFALLVPVEHAGQTVEVQAFRSGFASETTSVELVETAGNTASEVFPLTLGSPAAGTVLLAPEATFTGEGIPNSRIVVTRDREPGQTDKTLCETRVTSSGDWSCTSPALPAGSHRTTVTEKPTWPSAPQQSTGTAFAVAEAAVDDGVAQLPSLWSVTDDGQGRLVVRATSHGASDARITVGDHVDIVGARHGRFQFRLDPSLLGETATITGIRGGVDGRSLELPLRLVQAGATSPLTAPLVHGVTRYGPYGNFQIDATTDYFHDEWDVPSVIAKVDGEYASAAAATWNGALFVQLSARHAGKEVELITTRGVEQSTSTFFILDETDVNTAPETFPLDVTSPAEGAIVPSDTTIVGGTGIPGSSISVSDVVTRSGEIATADVLGDGTWTAELDGGLAEGDHALTVTETPYWSSVAPITSTRSFTVADDDGDGEGSELPLAVTSPTPGSSVVAPDNVVTFTGTGAVGADVEIVNGVGRVVASAVVDDDGTWSATGSLGHQFYELEVAQTVDGARSSIPTSVTVLAEPGVEQPFSIDTPALGGVVVAPDNVVAFAGRGTTGETVVLTAGTGREVVRAVVGADGTWSGRGTLGHQFYELATRVVRADGTHTDGTFALTVTAVDGRPFVLASPADGSTVSAADNLVTFAGTGTPGARVVLTAGTGRVVVDTLVAADGTFSEEGFLGHQFYELATSYTSPGEKPVTGVTTVTVTS